MIVITGKPGQLGNSLILYASFLAFSLEHGVAVKNPSFYRYSGYFSFTSGQNKAWLFHFLYYITRILVKLNSKRARYIDWSQQVNLDHPPELGDFKKILFVQGWKFRGDNILKKHKEKIKSFFKPGEQYQRDLDEFFKKNFSNPNEIIVGIHIRRGDYKTFENGKYFYELSEYSEVVKKTELLFKGRELHFLVCSNEKIHASAFDNIKHRITFGPGHELLDLYAFSSCHYLIGPPSTYTMWASFYGNVPLYMLRSPAQDFSLQDFKIQENF